MRKTKKVLALALSAAMVVSAFSGVETAQAAAKTKLSKTRLTVKVGKKTSLTLKNVKKKDKKKVKWSVDKKKIVSITVKNKKAVTIKGKKAGKAKITAKIGKKKYSCTVTVKKASTKKTTTTKKPASSGAVSATASSAPGQKDSLLFNPTQAPSGVQKPAVRVTAQPTGTPLPLNTAIDAGDPTGDRGEPQPVRSPFTLPSMEPGDVLNGTAKPALTAQPVTTASVTADVQVSGTLEKNGKAWSYQSVYFYQKDDRFSMMEFTESEGDFSCRLKGSDVGEKYIVKIRVNEKYFTIGTLTVYLDALDDVTFNYDEDAVKKTAVTASTKGSITVGAEQEKRCLIKLPVEYEGSFSVKVVLKDSTYIRKVCATIYDEEGSPITGNNSYDDTFYLNYYYATPGNYYLDLTPLAYDEYYREDVAIDADFEVTYTAPEEPTVDCTVSGKVYRNGVSVENENIYFYKDGVDTPENQDKLWSPSFFVYLPGTASGTHYTVKDGDGEYLGEFTLYTEDIDNIILHAGFDAAVKSAVSVTADGITEDLKESTPYWLCYQVPADADGENFVLRANALDQNCKWSFQVFTDKGEAIEVEDGSSYSTIDYNYTMQEGVTTYYIRITPEKDSTSDTWSTVKAQISCSIMASDSDE